MQVKRFEAKSMKEALEMVKSQLGPEAVILQAKEHQTGFGLSGVGSVEVTAAISSEVLQRKRMAETKLNDRDRTRYQGMSARKQKEFIDRVFNDYRDEHRPRPAVTGRQYIDIGDEESQPSASAELDIATQRIQSVMSEVARGAETFAEPKDLAVRDKSVPITISEVASAMEPREPQKDQKIESLQSEIKQLRSVIENFKSVPQNFVQPHPGADEGIPYDLSFMFVKLIDAGVSREHACEILHIADQVMPRAQAKKKPLVEAWVIRHMLDEVFVKEDAYAGRIHLFLGPSGQGKTSMLVKFASQLALNQNKKVAILTADCERIGGTEQLRIFSQILNVPFGQVRSQQSWDRILEKLQGFDHVLLDTPGYGLAAKTEVDRLRTVLPDHHNDLAVHYVQSTIAKDGDAFEIADRYREIGFHDVMFTRIDESRQHGLIYNFQKRYNIPLNSFGIGPHMPEDFEVASKERVIDLIFKLTKLPSEKGA